MKKFLLMAAVALMMAAPISAKVGFGFRGGLNITSLSGGIDTENRCGFYIGPTVKIGLPLGFDIDASALYDQRDGKVEETTFSKKSIDIPVNIRKGFGLGDMADVFIFAGPQIAFNVGDKDFGALKEWTMKSSDFSINVGAGVMLLSHLEGKVNYNIPCGKTGEMKAVSTAVSSSVSNIKAGAWQIGVAYYF